LINNENNVAVGTPEVLLLAIDTDERKIFKWTLKSIYLVQDKGKFRAAVKTVTKIRVS
jgi:hypothetical protein